MFIILAFLFGFILGSVVGLGIRLGKIEDLLARVVQVVTRAGPSIASRLIEQGTKVTVNDRWMDEVEFDERDFK